MLVSTKSHARRQPPIGGGSPNLIKSSRVERRPSVDRRAGLQSITWVSLDRRRVEPNRPAGGSEFGHLRGGVNQKAGSNAINPAPTFRHLHQCLHQFYPELSRRPTDGHSNPIVSNHPRQGLLPLTYPPKLIPAILVRQRSLVKTDPHRRPVFVWPRTKATSPPCITIPSQTLLGGDSGRVAAAAAARRGGVDDPLAPPVDVAAAPARPPSSPGAPRRRRRRPPPDLTSSPPPGGSSGDSLPNPHARTRYV